MVDDQHAAELARFRARFAATLKRYAPDWSGESYPTWRKYPMLPDDAPEQAAVALSFVKFLDAAISEPVLAEELRHWSKVLMTIRGGEQKEVNDRELIERGMASLKGLRNAADKANKKRADKRPDYASEVKAVMAKGVKYTPACVQVATKFDVVPETVRKHTPQLRPGKRQ